MSSVQNTFKIAVGMLRSKKYIDAIPLLENVIAEDKSLLYANHCLKYAIAMRDGVDAVEVPFGQRVFKFALCDKNIGHSMFHASGLFNEQKELEYCLKVIPKRSNIVDVGANTGNHTVFMSGMLEPTLVIPIEPSPVSADFLMRNVALNNMQIDGRGLGLAVGTEERSLYLHVPKNKDLVEARTSKEMQSSDDILVKTVRLDDLIPERVDFLKIDVEGFEGDVLGGATRILREDKPILMIELTTEREPLVTKTLSTFSYSPYIGFKGFGFRNIFFRVQ